ncbi:FAD-dependent oxidoreductase, partial [Mycobacterium sp.]|uniref:FAD-dependent oxidoreductase n=1 Tax=Mycobacterium sp. TaxID=1785 RepID=UPI003BB17253
MIACGAFAHQAVPGATTFGGAADIDEIRDLLTNTLEGRVARLLFAAPTNVGWTLPLYELCLLTGQHLVERHAVYRYQHGSMRRESVQIGLVTPEATPLAAFGTDASQTLSAMLEERGIAFHGERTPVRFHDNRLETLPGGDIRADRVVALPRLQGVPISGLPADTDGLIRTDTHGRLDDIADVYAAGDITTFPIKQGGIAAQQALCAAQMIAATAGATITPQP